jgi:hypothetical protein
MASEKKPGQFGVFELFVLTTLAAVIFAVIALPMPMYEKILPIVAVGLCFACWRNRNYLHPLQATNLHPDRRRVALRDFVRSTLIWPPLCIWFYLWRGYRSSHSFWFSDAVFWGSILILIAIATWKLTRALLPGQRWNEVVSMDPGLDQSRSDLPRL